MKWWPFARQPRPDVRPGQESVPEDEMQGVISRLAGFYNFAGAPFPLEFLDVLEPLAIFNPDVSQALQIWVNLGNTGHELAVETRNPDAALQRLNSLAATVYRTGGGVDGLVNHFMRQIPLMGALSAEWVVAPKVGDGLSDVAIVPVKRIRFRRVDGELLPFQLTNMVTAATNGYVQLNPFTYSYMPMQTADGSPYAIPSFYAALKNLEVQLDATANISSIIRKMGLLGFLDVALEIPERKPGESDDQFQKRLQNRLTNYAAAYRANLSKGVAVHYKDQEIKHGAVAPGSAAGAKQIWELNEEQIFSALDVPPSMAGRSYSTTETYAQVDYDRFTAKLGTARRMIKRFLEKGYTLDLLLRGLDARVSVTFNPDSGYKALEQSQAEGERINNVLSKRDGGIIDDDTAARELGYDAATGRRPGDTPPDGFFGSAENTVRFAYNRQLGRYEHMPERLTINQLEQPADDRLDQSYVAALQSVLEQPENEAIDAALFAAGGEFTDAGEFAQAVYEAFKTRLINSLAVSGIDRITARFVNDAWQRWRYEDKNHLRAGRRSVSTARRSLALDLSVVDRNALRYLTNIETHYFGRGNYLAKDETTGKQFVNWLQREYIANGLNIKDAATWDQFRQEFPALVRQTSYKKTVQLVSTTMSRIQNMGQTISLYEAGFKRYRIVGPSTPPVCKHCLAMLGRVFEVKAAATRLAKIVEKGFESTNDLPPFLTSKYSAETVEEMSDEELQAAGFETAPFHPECRHRKVAED